MWAWMSGERGLMIVTVSQLHCRNGVEAGDVFRSINIAFDEVDVLVLLRKGLEDGCNDMAWTTPTMIKLAYS